MERANAGLLDDVQVGRVVCWVMTGQDEGEHAMMRVMVEVEVEVEIEDGEVRDEAVPTDLEGGAASEVEEDFAKSRSRATQLLGRPCCKTSNHTANQARWSAGPLRLKLGTVSNVADDAVSLPWHATFSFCYNTTQYDTNPITGPSVPGLRLPGWSIC